MILLMSLRNLDFEDQKLMAACGVHCGVCPYFIADKSHDQRLKEKLAASIGMKPEQVECEGCNSEAPIFFCKTCDIKNCVQEKNMESCAECEEYPCKHIEDYPYKPFIQREKWDVTYRKKHGDQEWLKITQQLNTCPSCEAIAHWKARYCKACGRKLEERYV